MIFFISKLYGETSWPRDLGSQIGLLCTIKWWSLRHWCQRFLVDSSASWWDPVLARLFVPWFCSIHLLVSRARRVAKKNRTDVKINMKEWARGSLRRFHPWDTHCCYATYIGNGLHILRYQLSIELLLLQEGSSLSLFLLLFSFRFVVAASATFLLPTSTFSAVPLFADFLPSIFITSIVLAWIFW